MKKFRFSGERCLSVLLCLIIIIACNKQESSPNESSLNDKTILKSSLTDVELIRAIKGLNPAYNNISEVFDLLLNNMPLSNIVLTAVSAESRLENDFVEMVFIISAPVSQASLENLKMQRPTIQMQNIIISQDKPVGFKSFVIINDPARTIIFGEKLITEAVENADCSDCSSIVRSEPGAPFSIAISYGSDETGEPAHFRLFGCNPNKWVCGKAVRVNNLGDGRWYVQCEGEKRRCRSLESVN